jgi:hypothetical protein
MTWLLRLYPPPWRRRYGAEVAEMLAGRGFSLRTAVDLVAGAIDVWLHPSATLAAAAATEPATEERTMLSLIARLDCGRAFGPNIDSSDQRKASAVIVGCSLALTLAWMAAHFRFHDNPYIDSLSVMPFMIGMVASMRYTSLKGRAGSVQAVFIGGVTLLMTAFFLAVGWLTTQL